MAHPIPAMATVPARDIDVNIRERIEKDLGRAVTAAGVDFCDYQCNAAFAIAKERGCKPIDVANEIVAKFKSKIATAVAHPSGFVNISLTDDALNDMADDVIKVKKLPLPRQKRQTVFFDYGGANVAKQLHIGHLRAPIVGEALKRVYTALGHHTISDPHFGDWGLQMGLVLAELVDEKFVKDGTLAKEITLDTLNALYPTASARSKADPEFYARAAQITVELQKKTQPWYGLWQQIRRISVDNITQSYITLDCTFDTFEGESDVEPYMPVVKDILRKHGARVSEGCLVLDVAEPADPKPLPPVLLEKQNGGDLYATTDIATIYRRQREYKPDAYVYVADYRQELHFQQVFRAVRRGIVPADTRLTHVSFGTMNGTDGKPFKTRSGDTIKLDEVIATVTAAAAKQCRVEGIAQSVGLAALKFADLSNHVRKDYVFDLERFTSFEGKTGPYLLYTVARINSIEKKSAWGVTPPAPPRRGGVGEIISPTIKDILRSINKLTDAYTTSAENYTLNPICDAAYNLAQKFNLLYANETIQDNAMNLRAAELVRCALLFALDTLAIQPVDEM